MALSRIPLSWPYAPRDNTTGKDSRRVNVMDEQNGQTTLTLKRPGLTSAIASLAVGIGQGLVQFQGSTFAVIDDLLLTALTPTNTGTDGSAWTPTGIAPWGERSGAQAVTLGQTIYLMGGQVATTESGTVPVDAIIPSGDVWALSIDNTWKQCTASAPFAGRYFFSSAVCNGRIYIMGGYDGTSYFNDVYSSDNGTDWNLETSSAEWLPRIGATLVSNGTGLYLMGGTGPDNFNDVWFSTTGAVWNLVTADAEWSPRGMAMGFVYNNKFYLAGGAKFVSTVITPYNQTYVSTDAKNWTKEVDGTFPGGALYAAGCTVYSNKMWLVNGSRAFGIGLSNQVLESQDGNTWNLVTTSGPWARSTFGALVAAPTAASVAANAQTLYWLGGLDLGGNRLNVMYYGNINTALTTSTALNPTTTGQFYQFATFKEGRALLIKNQSNLWVYEGGVVTKVTDSGYPAPTVPGIAVLGTFAYVSDTTGLIRNCAADDAFQWPLLNALGADYEDDPAVCLQKYLNYIVLFGTYTTQVFYDTGAAVGGNPAGSHLAPYLNANLKLGCAAAGTVAGVGPNLAWVSQTKELNRQVMAFNGLTPVPISTPAIDKLLKSSSPSTMLANCISIPGHVFYVLTIGTGRATSFAYDFSTKQWYEWSRLVSSFEVPYIFNGTTALLEGTGKSYVLNQFSNGVAPSVYEVSSSAYDDVGVTFPVTLITGKVDAQNNNRKFLDALTVIGDQTTGTMNVQVTRDDYQTYSDVRVVDLSTNRPTLFRLGNFRRAAFKCTKTDSNPMYLEALELDVSQGS